MEWESADSISSPRKIVLAFDGIVMKRYGYMSIAFAQRVESRVLQRYGYVVFSVLFPEFLKRFFRNREALVLPSADRTADAVRLLKARVVFCADPSPDEPRKCGMPYFVTARTPQIQEHFRGVMQVDMFAVRRVDQILDNPACVIFIHQISFK